MINKYFFENTTNTFSKPRALLVDKVCCVLISKPIKYFLEIKFLFSIVYSYIISCTGRDRNFSAIIARSDTYPQPQFPSPQPSLFFFLKTNFRNKKATAIANKIYTIISCILLVV